MDLARDNVAIMLSSMKAHDPEGFAEAGKSQQPFITVFFAGNNKGQLDILLRGFGVKPDGQILETSESIGSGAVLFAGANQEISTYIHLHQDWSEVGYENAARRFVKIEIQAQPAKVRGPVAVLEINRFGETR